MKYWRGLAANVLALSALVATSVLGAHTPASATPRSACPIPQGYKVSVDGSYSGAAGGYTGSAWVKGTATLDSFQETWDGSSLPEVASSTLVGTGAMSNHYADERGSFVDSSSGSLRAESTVQVAMNPATCAVAVSVSARQDGTQKDPVVVNPFPNVQIFKGQASGTLIPGGVTTVTYTMGSDPCGGVKANSDNIDGWACWHRYDVAGGGYYGAAEGTLTVKLQPAGPSVAVDEVSAQHRPQHQDAWENVTDAGTQEGWPLRLVTRLTASHAVATKLHVRETTPGGFDKTASTWTTSKVGSQRWSTTLTLPPIPKTSGPVTRSFQVSVRYCPTAAPCSGSAVKESPPKPVTVVMEPPLTVEAVSFQARQDSKAPWRTVSPQGVWRGEQVRVLVRVYNATKQRIAFGVRGTSPGSAKPYASFWHVAEPGSVTLRAMVTPAKSQGVVTRTFNAGVDFCPSAVACPSDVRRSSGTRSGSYVESPPLAVRVTELRQQVSGNPVYYSVAPGATSVATDMAESSAFKLVIRVTNQGPEVYHRLVVTETTPGSRWSFPQKWRLSGSGVNGLDYPVSVDGAAMHNSFLGYRTFTVDVQACPSTYACRTDQLRTVTTTLRVGVKPLVTVTPSAISWTSNSSSNDRAIPESRVVTVPLGASDPFAVVARAFVRDTPARYRIEVTDLATGDSSYTNWMQASKADFVNHLGAVGGLPGSRATQRVLNIRVRYCPSLRPCVPDNTIATTPQRVIVKLRP